MAKRKKIYMQNRFNFEYDPIKHAEQNESVSNTQPGMVEPMDKLFARFQNGEALPIRQLEYGSDMDMGETPHPAFKPGKDLSDLTEIKNRQLELQELIDAAEEQQQKEKELEKIDIVSPEQKEKQKTESEETD